MYRLYQSNAQAATRPPGNGGECAPVCNDGVSAPMPEQLGWVDDYTENGIPFQVTVQQDAVGDEPSALGDGSASAIMFQREFERLWAQLEQEALRNGWTHAVPPTEEADEGEEEEAEEDDAAFFRHPGAETFEQASVLQYSVGGESEVAAASAMPSQQGLTSDSGSRGPYGFEPSAQISGSADNRQHEMVRRNLEPERNVRASASTTQVMNSFNRSVDHEENNNMLAAAAATSEEDFLLHRSARISAEDDDPGPQLLQAARQSWIIPTETFQRRAKYISAGIIKLKKDTHMGLELKTTQDGAIEIENVASNGFLYVSGTPLQAGDRITGIKTSKASYTCGHNGGMRKNEVLRMLRRSTGRLTIIAENPSGDPDRIECMTSKPHPEFGTGIFFLSGSQEAKTLQIHSVPSNGLFANSLLHRGAKVLSINGVDCSELDACVATDIVKSAPRFVCIVAESVRQAVDYSIDPAAHLRTVPEAEDRRPSFGIFNRRRSGAGKSENSQSSPRSVDC